MLKKKWNQVFVIAALAALTMSACSSTSSNNSTKEASGNGLSDEAVTIKLHTWYPKKADNWDLVIAEFEKKYPNIKVEFNSAEDNNSNEYYKKLDLAAASGDELDVLMFSNMTFLGQRAELGLLEPIDAYLEKEGASLEEYTADTRINNVTYGLPGKLSIPMVFINENRLNQAGLDIPKNWSWDKYMEYAKAMTTTADGKTQYGTYFHSWIMFGYFIQNMGQSSTGANLTTDDGLKANVDTPAVRKSLEIRLQGEKEGSATPYSEIISQKLNYRPQYFNQDTSMIPMASFLVPETGGTEQVPATFKTVFAPFPTMNEGDPSSANVSSDVLGIYSKSKHKEAAYTFIRWFTTEGIVLQGKNFTSWKNADLNEVVDKIIAGTKTPEMIDKESLISVLENTKQLTASVPVPYHAELEKVMLEGFDSMMLSGVDIDTTIKNIQEKVQKIIDSKQ